MATRIRSDQIEVSPINPPERFHLIRVFRKATGLTPHNWLMDRRVHLACNLLRAGLSATHVAAQCGCSDQSHLTRVFKSRLGITPGRFRLSKACA